MRRPLLGLCALALACNSTPAPRKLVILHTNDEHSHLLGAGPEADDFPPATTAGSGAIKGGVARRAVVLKKERDAAAASGAASLTVSAGDNMIGTLTQMAALSGAPDFVLLKVLGYDVTTLGNHEFDFGPNALAAIIKTALAKGGMPAIVSSNIVFSGKAGDADLAKLYDPIGTDQTLPIHRSLVVTTSNGLRVGFVGIMGANAAFKAPLKSPTSFSVAYGQNDSNQLAALSQIFDDIQPVVDSLHHDQKVDLVVALSHGGFDPVTPLRSEDPLIAQSVSGIDVIVSGHTHTQGSASITNLRSGKAVFVQQAGRFGDNVGRISLTVDGNGNVSVDSSASALIPVDDTIVADPTISQAVASVIDGLETKPVAGNLSFLGFTLLETGATFKHDVIGDLYNFALVPSLNFDIDNSTKHTETELLDLTADAQLAAASALKPGAVDVALEGYGELRVPRLEHGRSNKLGFGDVFRALPLGGTTATTGPSAFTPGYPLCYFGIYLAELKAAFEVTSGFSYADEDFYVVPSGFKFEYDTSRAPYNPNGDPLDKYNGRVTRISRLSPVDLAAGNFDGNYLTVFDVNIPASISPTGWLAPPLGLVRVAGSLYLATFATFAGVHLKDPVTGAPIPGNDPSASILHRPAPDGTEIKEWEALGAYVRALAAANGGKLPARYSKGDPSSQLPRRAICSGPLCVQ